MTVALLGYAPDLDPTTPGVLTNCSALIPSFKGMRGAPGPQNTTLPALASACKGAGAVRKLDGTSKLYAGSATKLYEAGTSSWTDRTRASGGDYGLTTSDVWTFAQYADQSFAAAKTDILQVATTGAFANAAANAPQAAIVETANNFIFLFNVNDQGAIYDSADRPHGWWAARSSATWTPSVANEAYTGDLKSTPGKVTAGKRFGQAVIAYKARSMYQGVYIGQAGWDFSLIPGEAGAVSAYAVVDVGTDENPKHIFMGEEDFYQFDGSRPVSIGNPLSKTVFGEMNKSYSYACKALHDRINKRIYFYYPVGSSQNPDRCVVYNYKTLQWGRDDRQIEAVVDYISAGLTYDDLGTYYATYDDFPSGAYDTAFLAGGSFSPAVFNASHVVQTLTGASTTSTMTCWDMGADEAVSLLSRAQPRFLVKPSTATMTAYYRANVGNGLTTGSMVSMDSKGRFDVLQSANWHRLAFEFVGDVEMSAMRVEIQPDGDE